MTIKGGTTPACAACKYQRRKCAPSCPLAPYFPAHKATAFQSVHRLFGVSNVTKLLKSLQNKDHRDDAVASMIYEADMREKFPVQGCSMAICHANLLLERALEEYRKVLRLLALHRPSANIDPPPRLPCWTTQSQFGGGGDFAVSSSHGPSDFLMNNNDGLFIGAGCDGVGQLVSFPDAPLWSNNDVPSVDSLQMEGLGFQERENDNRSV